jgi:hypothetical protein
MLKLKGYTFILILGISITGCDTSICDDGDRRVFFDSFQNRLKIDPGYFEMASDRDTVPFRLVENFNGFLNNRSFICGPVEHETFSSSFDNGSGLNLSTLFGFSFQIQLYFNEDRTTYFSIQEVDGDYFFYDEFSETILEEYSVRILPVFEFNGIEFNEVTEIQAIVNGQLLEELIYQRENGILSYRNLTDNFEYNQIRRD